MLSLAPTGNGYGYVPLPWSEIKNLCEMAGYRLSEWKLLAIRRMESVWLAHKNKPHQPSEQAPVSIELFDAWNGLEPEKGETE
jgi:hypothetical protein